MIRKLLSYLLMLMPLLVMSCGEDDYGVPERSAETIRQLSVLDAAITERAPSAMSLAEKGMESAQDSFTYYDFFIRQGKIMLLSPRPDKLLTYTYQTKQFIDRQSESPRLNGLKAYTYELQANYYHRYYIKQQRAIELRTIAYEAMLKSDNHEFLPELCANMADSYTQNNDLAKAAYWYRRALFLADSLNLPDSRFASLYLGIARVYLSMEDFEKSLHYFTLCERLFDVMPPNMKLLYLCCRGNYYYFVKEYEQSLVMFGKMKKLLESEKEDGIDMAICMIDMADIYLNLGKMEEAADYLERAEKFFKEVNMQLGIYYANTIRIGMAARGVTTIDIEKMLANEHFNITIDKNIVNIRNRYLVDYYKRVGDYRAALLTLERERAMEDSAAADRQVMRAAEMILRFREDTLMLHHQLIVEKKDNYLYVTWGGVLVAIILLSLLLWGWWLKQHKHRLQAEMTMMRLRIDNIRNRVSPHFIFNVLNNHMQHLDSKQREEIIKLSRLIRASLDMSDNRLISLDEELHFVEYYLSVEQTILGSEFSYQIDAPAKEQLQRIIVPSMFIQILVENSIKHGLKGKEGEKRLRISVATNEEGTTVKVIDNGRGFNIMSMESRRTKNGLTIIRRTIQLLNEQLHGQQISLQINNKEDEQQQVIGCEVSLFLPIQLDDKIMGGVKIPSPNDSE